MSEIIYSISEAFSMQPASFYLGMPIYPDQRKVAVIAKEKINFPVAGDPFEYWYYVGRDDEGNKLFEYRAETVNVIYKKSKP